MTSQLLCRAIAMTLTLFGNYFVVICGQKKQWFNRIYLNKNILSYWTNDKKKYHQKHAAHLLICKHPWLALADGAVGENTVFDKGRKEKRETLKFGVSRGNDMEKTKLSASKPRHLQRKWPRQKESKLSLKVKA